MALLITPATQTQAGERLVDGSGEAYLVEVVVRPVSLVGTILGTGFYIITWPFSIASGSCEAAKRELIDKPFDATFKRKFGDFSSLKNPKVAPAPATPATQPIAKTQPTPTAPTPPVQPQPIPAPTVEEK